MESQKIISVCFTDYAKAFRFVCGPQQTGKFLRKWEFCQGPASAGSRGTLRMNDISKAQRERESRLGCVQQGLALHFFFFTVAFIPSVLYIFKGR